MVRHFPDLRPQVGEFGQGLPDFFSQGRQGSCSRVPPQPSLGVGTPLVHWQIPQSPISDILTSLFI